MSMRDYPAVDYGFLFPHKAEIVIARKAVMEHDVDLGLSKEEEADLLDEDYLNNDIDVSLIDLREVLENVFGLDVSYYSGFTGEAETLTEITELDPNSSISASFDEDNFLFLPLEKGPTLIGTAYASVTEIIEEVQQALFPFKKELEDADVNLMANIVSLTGVVFG